MECICGEIAEEEKAWFERYLYEQKKPKSLLLWIKASIDAS